MRKFIDLVTEAPISIGTHDFGNEGSFSDRDQRLHSNDKAHTKIKKRWETSTADLNLFLYNIKDEAPNVALSGSFFGDRSQFIGAAMDQGFVVDPNAINCILTQNFGGDTEVPLTAWMVAHRLWHAVTMEEKWAYRSQNDMLQSMLGIVQNAYGCGISEVILHAIGRSKACRDQNLSNPAEIIGELFAEYLLFGKIKLRELPQVLERKGYSIDRYEMRDTYGNERWADIANKAVVEFEQEMNDHFAELIPTCIGKTYVF